MREVVLDTETTGLDPNDGHRIVEIACVELENYVPTGKSFRALVHPEREIPEDALRVHGISLDDLADAPAFADIIEDFMEFIGDAPLIIHNAEFDLRFLNAELTRAGREPLPFSRGVDTIAIAKRRFPGARYSLDELCRRFNIDLSVREKHGALIDAGLLAEVYLELIGGRQTRLHLAPADSARVDVTVVRVARPRPIPLADLVSAAERESHARFIAAELGNDAIWRWAA
jgi:DNA polymerase III subunit epsilon